MRNHLSTPSFLRLSVLLLALTLSACSLDPGRGMAGHPVDDATITTSVKAKIFEDPFLRVHQINVKTKQGVVELSGLVNSDQSGHRAVALTRSLPGVKDVKENLVVQE